MILLQSDKWLLLRFALVFFLLIRMDKTICYGHLLDSSNKTNDLIGYCAPYHGKVCKSFVSYDQVWYSNVCYSIQVSSNQKHEQFFMSNVSFNHLWLITIDLLSRRIQTADGKMNRSQLRYGMN